MQQPALTGQLTGKRCDITPHAYNRMNGILGNSHTWANARIDSGLIVRQVDSWGYCGNGNSDIVVPEMKLENWLAPHDVWAGVMIYGRRTDQLEYRPKVAFGELAGAAISLSQSRRINASPATPTGGW